MGWDSLTPNAKNVTTGNINVDRGIEKKRMSSVTYKFVEGDSL